VSPTASLPTTSLEVFAWARMLDVALAMRISPQDSAIGIVTSPSKGSDSAFGAKKPAITVPNALTTKNRRMSGTLLPRRTTGAERRAPSDSDVAYDPALSQSAQYL
jgi:hypothetical protein